MQLEANVLSLELEKVNKVVPIAYEAASKIGKKVKKSSTLEEVSYRALRGPIQINPGGKYGSVNLDGGALGRGGASAYVNFTVSPVERKFGVEISQRALDATKSEKRAVAQLLVRESTNGTNEFATQEERSFFTAGDGILATVGTNVSGDTWNTTGNFMAQRIRVGQSIVVYTAAAAAVVGTAAITAINYNTGTFTLDASPGGMAATNVLLPEGLTGATPAWVNGEYYQNSSATTGSWQALSRVTYPNLVCPSVNASSSYLTTSYFRQLMAKFAKYNGNEAWDTGNWNIVTHYAQVASYQDLGDQITEIMLTAGSPQKNTDVAANAKPDMMKMSGFEVLVSPNADPTRIDWNDWDNWGRGVVRDAEIFRDANGNLYRTPVSTSDGSPLAAVLWHFLVIDNYFTYNPRRNAFIYGLSVPTGTGN